MAKRIYVILGIVFLAVGVLGIFLPLLPTTPFLLLAAACFSKSSEKLHGYLINHPRLGPPVKAWRESGAISKKAKAWALFAILLSTLAVFANKSIPSWGLAGYLTVIIGVVLFISTRPNQ